MSDPRPLLDSDVLGERQRRVLEDAKDAKLVEPPAGAEAAVWEKIAALTGGGNGGDGGGGGGGGGAGALGKLALGGGAVAVVAVAVAVAASRAPARDASPPETASPSASAVSDRPASPARGSIGADAAGEAPVRSVDDLPEARPVSPVATARAAPSAIPAPSLSNADSGEDPLLAETRLVKSARHALAAGDTVTALRDLRAAEARFPNGALVQEREVLTIEALAAEKRTAEADARARAFLAAHPESPFAKRVSAYVSR